MPENPATTFLFAALLLSVSALIFLTIRQSKMKKQIVEMQSALKSAGQQLNRHLVEMDARGKEIFAVLENMSEQVIAVNSAGRIQLLNASARRLFNIGSEKFVGRPLIEIVRQASIQEMLQRCIKTGKEDLEEINLYFPEEKIFEARAVPIFENNMISAVLLVLHDITRIQKLEQVRKEFVANVSHELRTPLTNIQGFAETLASDSVLDSKQRIEFAETIQEEAKRLSALVENILNLSSLESGSLPVVYQPVLLYQVIQEVQKLLSPLAEKQRVQFQSELPASLPEVLGDKNQLKQLFINLIENAIRFNKEGGSVFLKSKVQQDGLTIVVEDTGMGIPKEDLPRIFERFYRVDKARSREHGGSGLGLSIVKHIVEAHQGTIQVESQLGKGSSFAVTLPLLKNNPSRSIAG